MGNISSDSVAELAQLILDAKLPGLSNSDTFRGYLEFLSGEHTLFAIISEEAAGLQRILSKLAAGETRLTATEREDLKYSVIAMREQAGQLREVAADMKSDLDRDIPLWSQEQKAELKNNLPEMKQSAAELEAINASLGELCRTVGITLPKLPGR